MPRLSKAGRCSLHSAGLKFSEGFLARLPGLNDKAVDGADAALEALERRLRAEAALRLPEGVTHVLSREREWVLGIDGVYDGP